MFRHVFTAALLFVTSPSCASSDSVTSALGCSVVLHPIVSCNSQCCNKKTLSRDRLVHYVHCATNTLDYSPSVGFLCVRDPIRTLDSDGCFADLVRFL